MVVCYDFNSSGNAQGLKLETGAAMNIKEELSQGQDDEIKYIHLIA